MFKWNFTKSPINRSLMFFCRTWEPPLHTGNHLVCPRSEWLLSKTGLNYGQPSALFNTDDPFNLRLPQPKLPLFTVLYYSRYTSIHYILYIIIMVYNVIKPYQQFFVGFNILTYITIIMIFKPCYIIFWPSLTWQKLTVH